jgi:hypothetical protein
LINVIFSEDFVQGFLKWNDQRNIDDHETGVGGNMQKRFAAVHLAMYGGDNVRPDNDVIDSDDNNDQNRNDDLYGTIDTFVGHKDEDMIEQYIKLANLDPSDYLQINAVMLRDWVTKLLKVRNVVVQNMKKSGEHSDNPYDYVEVALKKTKFRKLLGEFPLYYFCLKANLCDDFDKRFQPFMSGFLKGDSATELESMIILTNDSRRMKVDVLNDDDFMVTIKNRSITT